MWGTLLVSKRCLGTVTCSIGLAHPHLWALSFPEIQFLQVRCDTEDLGPTDSSWVTCVLGCGAGGRFRPGMDYALLTPRGWLKSNITGPVKTYSSFTVKLVPQSSGRWEGDEVENGNWQ